MPVRFETAEEDVWVMGAVVEINADGMADSIEQVMVPAPSLSRGIGGPGTLSPNSRPTKVGLL